MNKGKDISNLRESVKKLQEEADRFKDIFNNAPLSFQSLDRDGRFLEVNDTWLNTLGYSKKVVEGKYFSDFLHPEWVPFFEKKFPEFKRTGSVKDVEFRIMHKKGHYLDILFEGCVGYNPDGSVRQTYCVFRDITGEKDGEQLYQDLVEKAGIAILIDDMDGKFTYFNEKFTEIFGYTRMEISEKSIESLVHPEDVAAVMKRHKSRLKGKDAPRRYEFRGVRKNGETIYLEVETVLLEKQGKFEGTRSYLWDRTLRKAAERKLEESESQMKNILENSTNLFYSHTSGHVLTYLSPQVEQILGYTLEEALVKWTEFATDHPVNEIGFKKTMEAIKTGERQSPYELELLRKDGEKIWVEVREFPHVVKGKTVAISGSLTEITERKKATEALQKSEEQFRLIAENTGDNIGITTFDRKAEYVYVSPSIKSVLGYKPEDLLGKSFFDFIHSEDKGFLFKLLLRYLNMKAKKLILGKETELSEKVEYRFLNSNGEWRLLQSTINIMGDRLLAVTRDITEQKRDREEIVKLKEGLEEEVDAKTRELKEKVADLERFFNATVDRELRMEELHRENEELKVKLKNRDG